MNLSSKSFVNYRSRKFSQCLQRYRTRTTPSQSQTTQLQLSFLHNHGRRNTCLAGINNQLTADSVYLHQPPSSPKVSLHTSGNRSIFILDSDKSTSRLRLRPVTKQRITQLAILPSIKFINQTCSKLNCSAYSRVSPSAFTTSVYETSDLNGNRICFEDSSHNGHGARCYHTFSKLLDLETQLVKCQKDGPSHKGLPRIASGVGLFCLVLFLYNELKERTGLTDLPNLVVRSAVCATKSSSCRNSDSDRPCNNLALTEAIERARDLCMKRKEEVGSPGIAVCVSVDGQQVYAEGFGYADVENRQPMKPSSVLRIASISKSITATITAHLYEKGLIDLEKNVQHYVPSFPTKEYKGEEVTITVRQVLSHLSGIRHYKVTDDFVYTFDAPISAITELLNQGSQKAFFELNVNKKSQGEVTEKEEKKSEAKVKQSKKEKAKSELQLEEYYITKYFPTTAEALEMFAKDRLMAKPGDKFIYTTFGYTLLQAIVEAAAKKSFETICDAAFKQWGLKETYFDHHSPIIYNRARCYVKDDNTQLVNAPYIDLSYKWAGGGLLSTVEDVVKFGNIWLYSFQHADTDPGYPGYLKKSTVETFWTSQSTRESMNRYSLGFELGPDRENFGMCEKHTFGVGHTGAAVGASSALYILPRSCTRQTQARAWKQDEMGKGCSSSHPPQGVVVAVFVNMISVSVRDVAEEIARTFEHVDLDLSL